MKRNQRRLSLQPVRSGVSLLEVMVAIGVTSIGLLGVLALIPLAGAQVRHGQVLERSIVIGESALSEMRTRGWLNAENWVNSTTGQAAINLATEPPRAFCLDPRGVADGLSGAFFPTNATANMGRITVWNRRAGTTPPNNTADLNRLPSKELADFLCQSQDDLSVESTTRDRTLPAYQLWAPQDTQTSPTASATRRQFSGSMSWMATIVPHGDSLYRVSVAVFSQRVPGEEVTATVNFLSGGIAGGDVELQFATASDELKIAEGSWVFLSGRMQVSQNSYQPVFHWYRVLMSDRDPTDKTKFYATLAGPDWDPRAQNVQATIIPGTVNVYERIMPLELSNLWGTPN
jgi:hypothetical protein